MRTVPSLRMYFEAKPSREREKYIRALSHCRRHAIVRLLNENPGMGVEEIGHRTDMPRTTVDRILAQLDKAKIVDLNRHVCRPNNQLEETLLEMTLAPLPTFREKWEAVPGSLMSVRRQPVLLLCCGRLIYRDTILCKIGAKDWLL